MCDAPALDGYAYLCDAPALDSYALGELLTLTLLQVRQGGAALLRVLPLGSYQHG
jgi:hypothetical protein